MPDQARSLELTQNGVVDDFLTLGTCFVHAHHSEKPSSLVSLEDIKSWTLVGYLETRSHIGVGSCQMFHDNMHRFQ